MKSNHLRSPMRVARGLGSAKGGTKHWWWQRLTAIALVPLSMWFVVSLLQAALFPEPYMVAEWLTSPLVAIALALLVIALFWHASLGVQVIIEDYCKTPPMKFTLLILNSFLCFGFAVISLLSIFRLHMLDLSGIL